MSEFQNELGEAAQAALDGQLDAQKGSVGGGEGSTPTTPVNPAAIRKSTQQSMLKALSNATGTEFTSMEDLIATVARLSQQSQGQAVSQPKAETQEEKQKRVTANDLQDQLQAMKTQFEQQQTQLRQKELDGSIRNAMGDKFDPHFSDYTISEIKKNLFEQDGEWLVVDSKNRQRYTGEGNPMTVRDLIEEMARNNPKLLRQVPQVGGSGLRPQGAVFDGAPGDGEMIPDYSKDPAAFNAWANRRGLGKGAGLKGITASVTNSTQVKKMY
jgi:hypothetical protein